MQAIMLRPELRAAVEDRAETLFQQHARDNNIRVDRLFVGLLVFQWIIGIVVACRLSPQTWTGTVSAVHPHVWAALFFGGGIIAHPLLLTVMRPGAAVTRHFIAAAQMLFSALLIHLTGGRLETHFHIFGSLAFLAFYRDWRVLVTASVITAADHLLRGFYLPQSIYGVLNAGAWRWLEHAGWVVFEDIFLIISIRQSRTEMRRIAQRQAQLEATNAGIEAIVVARTAELQASEASLRESQERYEVAVSGSHEGIWDWDIASGAVYYSPRYKELLGYQEDEFENLLTSFFACLHPDDHDRINASMQAHLETDVPFTADYRLLTKHGDYHWFHARGKAVRDAQGRPYRVAGSLTDITERKLLETQLALAQKMESIGQLAAGVAHEINTPIQYIGDNVRFLGDGFVALDIMRAQFEQLLRWSKTGTGTPELAERIEAAFEEADIRYYLEEAPNALRQSLEGIQRVSHIVQAMKHFSHPGAKEKTPVDINRAIDSTITVARSEWKYAAEVVTDFDTELPMVPCLPGDFNQVVLNLLVNAAHAIIDVIRDSEHKGVITISTRRSGAWVEIRIADTGTGIPHAARSKIFDPFYTTKEVGKGTGQGLAIAHSIIVEKHGGQIAFETEMGRGTTFILRLPLPLEAETCADANALQEAA